MRSLVLCYGGWLAATYAYAHCSLWVIAPLVALLVRCTAPCSTRSFMVIPTRWNSVNRLLGIVPLSLWLPFERYRALHRTHHIDERLTDPLDDPESFYWTPEDWARLHPIGRAHPRSAADARRTGPARLRSGASAHSCAPNLRALLARRQRDVRAIWLEHLAWCVPVMLWVHVRVRHAAVDLLLRDRGSGKRHLADPLLRRASRAPGRARAHCAGRGLVDPRASVSVQQPALAAPRVAR